MSYRGAPSSIKVSYATQLDDESQYKSQSGRSGPTIRRLKALHIHKPLATTSSFALDMASVAGSLLQPKEYYQILRCAVRQENSSITQINKLIS